MKALTLLALCLALGVGVLFYLVNRGGDGRDSAPRNGAPSAQIAEPDPVPAIRTPSVPEEAEPVPAGRLSVESNPPAPARRFLEGVVIGEAAPVQGAHLELVSEADPLAEARTDERGRFRLEYPPPAGALVLRVRARGFVPLERTLGAKPFGGTEILGNVRLVRGTELRGRVVDGRGAGIADAEIAVEPRNSGADVIRARARTGPDGRFELADSPPGQVLVRASARGFGERRVDAVASRDSREIVIALEPGTDLRLLIHAPGGAPIEGAEVSIQSTDPRAPSRTERSDAQGRVLFEGLSASVWNARVVHSDYRPTGRGQIDANGVELAIECQPWPAITGVVLAPGGSPPPPGTQVFALPASAPGDRIAQSSGGLKVESDGRFRIGGLRPGDWTVRVSAPGFAPVSSQPVRLGIQGDGFAGTLSLQEGARLRLAITLEEKPVAGAEVELQLSPPTPAQLWSLQGSKGAALEGKRWRSGADGSVELSNLAAGKVWVAVFAEGCPPTTGGPYAVANGHTLGPLRVELERGARVRGRVTRSEGGSVGGSQVRVVDRGAGLGLPLTLAADEEGRFSTAWLPAGRYSIEAFVPGNPTLRSGAQEIDLRSGEERELDLGL